jgi:3-hydroxyisobutyrate dehydrogenase-like beta-hydroxyacid dehydrogenase
VARACTVVFTILADDVALEQVTLGEQGLLSGLERGGIHVSSSTVSPALGRRLAEAHQARGTEYVAAPVFGRPDAAAAAKLWVCLSGAEAARDRVRPLLQCVGQGVFEFGDTPEAAHVVKLAGNFMIGSAIEAMGEAFVLAQKHGIERSAFYELFSQTLFACPIYQNYGRILVEGKFLSTAESSTLFAARLLRKDFGLVLDAAREQLTPMPVANVVHNHLTALVARGEGELDGPAFTREIEREAGL